MSEPLRKRKPALPDGWVAYPSRTYPGKVYFFNHETNQPIWQDRLAEFYDLHKGCDDVGLRDGLDDGSKVVEALKLLSNQTKEKETLQYIPTKIQRKPSSDDSTSLSLRKSPSPELDELRNIARYNNTLESEANHPFSRGSPSDRYSPNLFEPYHISEYNSSFSTFSDLNRCASNNFQPPQNNSSRSTVVPENLYSSYQSHICSTPHPNNNSVDGSSPNFSFFSSQESRRGIENKIFIKLSSPELSPFSNNSTRARRGNSPSPQNFISNADECRRNTDESSGSLNDSPSQKQNRNKFELEGNMSNLNDCFWRSENRRDSHSSAHATNNVGSSCWRPMLSTRPSLLSERLNNARLRSIDSNGEPPQNCGAQTTRPNANYTSNLDHHGRGSRHVQGHRPSSLEASENSPSGFFDGRKPGQKCSPTNSSMSPENLAYRSQANFDHAEGPRQAQNSRVPLLKTPENIEFDYSYKRVFRQPHSFSQNSTYPMQANFDNGEEPRQADNFRMPIRRTSSDSQLNFDDGRNLLQARNSRTLKHSSQENRSHPRLLNFVEDDQSTPWSTNNSLSWSRRPNDDWHNRERQPNPFDCRSQEKNNLFNFPRQQENRFHPQDRRYKFNGQRDNNYNATRHPNRRPYNRRQGLVDRHLNRSQFDDMSQRPADPYLTDDSFGPTKPNSFDREPTERLPSHHSIQDRLVKVQQDTLKKGIPPVVRASPKLLSPKDLIDQFSKERPDIVQVPKHYSSSECFDNESTSFRKRRAISISNDLESSGSLRETSFHKQSPSPTSKRKVSPEKFDDQRPVTRINDQEIRFEFRSPPKHRQSPHLNSEINPRTASPPCLLHGGTSPKKIDQAAASVEKETSLESMNESPTSGKAESASILKRLGSIHNQDSKESIGKRVKFSEKHEERLYDSESGKLIPLDLNSPMSKSNDSEQVESADSVVAESRNPVSAESSSFVSTELKESSPCDSDEPMPSDEEDLTPPDSSYLMSAEEQQLEAFSLCDKPKQSMQPSRSSDDSKRRNVDFRKRGNFTPAQQRLETLRKSINNNKELSSSPIPVANSGICLTEVDTDAALMNYVPSKINPTINQSCNASYSANEEEPMEWEEIPIRVIETQVNETRLSLSCLPKKPACWSPPEVASILQRTSFFIVLDTNILLSTNSFLASLRDTEFKEWGYPTIVIPWQVIEELDWMKDRKCVTQRKAIAAKNFLFENFSNEHPRMRGQTWEEWRDTPESLQNPDDSILHCAMKLRQDGKNFVILVTNDKNLVTKAKVEKVKCYTQEQILEKMKNNLQGSNGAVKKIGEISEGHVEAKEVSSLVDRLICALKTELLEYFSKVIQKGMIRTFSKAMWKKRCIIQPPWTCLSDCLSVLDKHSFSILSPLPSGFEKAVKEVRFFFLDQEKGKKIDVPRVIMALKSISVVLGYLKNDEECKQDAALVLDLVEKTRKTLTASCRSSTKTDSNTGSVQSPLSCSTIQENSVITAVASTSKMSPCASNQSAVAKADSAMELNGNSLLRAVNNAYSFCRNMCANIGTALDIPHSLKADNNQIDKNAVRKNPLTYEEDLYELQLFIREWAGLFRRLINLNKKGELSSPYHKEILELGSVLQKFLSLLDRPSEIRNTDTFVFFTNPKFEEMRRKGFEQLTELENLVLKCLNELSKRILNQ